MDSGKQEERRFPSQCLIQGYKLRKIIVVEDPSGCMEQTGLIRSRVTPLTAETSEPGEDALPQLVDRES